MTFNINCIVLHAFMFNDSKMMVDVLSREEGRLSCVLNTGHAVRKGIGGSLRLHI